MYIHSYSHLSNFVSPALKLNGKLKPYSAACSFQHHLAIIVILLVYYGKLQVSILYVYTRTYVRETVQNTAVSICKLGM